MTPTDMIADRYKILDTLGRGGMATVYLANDKQLDRLVAVKMLLVKELSDGQAIRFQNEAKAIGRLNHSAIMAALDFGVTNDGQPYLVLDYKEGTTLDTMLEESGRLEIRDALLIASRIADGLAYAHKAGILHRDIKPSNIYITRSDSTRESVKILDFGIAKFQSTQALGSTPDSAPDDSQYLTKTGTIIGSPAYMSPEQARSERVDERADIYSLGCVLFEMLTGKPPIVGSTAVETLAKKASESAPTLVSQAPDLSFSSTLEAVVSKCLEVDRCQRYLKAADLLTDLESQLSELSEEQGQPEPVESDDDNTGSSDARHRVFQAVVMILLLVLIGSTMAFFMFSRTPTDSAGETLPNESIREIERQEKAVLPVSGIGSDTFVCTEKGCEIRVSANDETLKAAARQMKELSTTSLAFNGMRDFDGDKLRYFNHLPLEALKMQGMNLDRNALTQINEMSTLLFLRLNNCTFESTIIKPDKLPELFHLSLDNDTLCEEDCKNIAKLKSLKALSLEGAQGFSPEFLRELGKNRDLRNIVIGGEHVTVEHINMLPQLNLSDIGVFKMPLVPTDELMKNIGKLKHLGFANFNDFELEKGCLRYLEPLDALGFIKFNQVGNLDSSEMTSVAKLKSVQEVELNSLSYLSDNDIAPLLSCKTLKVLRLLRVPHVSDEALKPFRKRGVKATSKNGLAGFVKTDGIVGDAFEFADMPDFGKAIKDGNLPDNGSMLGLDDQARHFFDKDGVCKLSGLYTETKIMNLAEKLKSENRTNLQISMTGVENFRGEWLKYLVPLKPTRFKATGIDFDDATLRYIGEMTNLKQLGLDQNPFQPGSLHYLKGLQKVEHISMTGVTVNDSDMETISSLKALKRIDMKGANGFSIKGLQALTRLPRLNEIEIGGAALTKEQARCLQSLKHVKNVELAGRLNRPTSEFLEEMIAWPKIERLTISSINVKPADIKVIAKFPALNYLKLYNLTLENKEAVFQMLAVVNKLVGLELDTASNLTDKDLSRLTLIKGLKHVTLLNNETISREAISDLGRAMPNVSISVEE